MDKSCPSSGDSLASSSSTTSTTTTTTHHHNNNGDQFLRHLNKLSHKIRKPPLDLPLLPPQPQPPPPVYNINKSDFRDVVQKLAGSPAHAPPIHAPKPASSRLQRIRPPPLAQLSTLPPPLLNCAVPPLSPLPPLPTCHAAAESPISAHTRFLRSSISAVDVSNNPTALDPQLSLPPSPKSLCPLLSPNLRLPISPTVSGVPSPKWRDL